MRSSGRPSSTETVMVQRGAPSKPPCSSNSIALIVNTSFLAMYSSLSAYRAPLENEKVSGCNDIICSSLLSAVTERSRDPGSVQTADQYQPQTSVAASAAAARLGGGA